jgi:membrane-associated protease RseP (regulator of RpoE activity)
MNAKTFREMQVNTRGQFGGHGIQVTMENGLVKVISPIDDTPAFRAGIEPGDVVTHLDGEPVQGQTLSQAVEKMRGKVGTDIKLTVRRKGKIEPFDVTITRAIIDLKPVTWEVKDDIGIITPYLSQVKRTRKLLETKGLGCEVKSVDGFQGREKEVILISFVRSNPAREIGFVKDARRLNVAMTRAKTKLVMIGDRRTLEANAPFDALFGWLASRERALIAL